MIEMTDLYQKITSLESQHKRSQLNGVYGELMEHRRKLKDLITRKHLRNLQREVTPFPQKIADEFRTFYQNLYNLHPPPRTTRKESHNARITDYLSNTITNTIDQDSASMLDAPISMEEQAAALKVSKSGKAPGPDGFSNLLLPWLTKAINAV
ncbi:Hypothetical predicted protein, partial [Pelobates cultripes]